MSRADCLQRAISPADSGPRGAGAQLASRPYDPSNPQGTRVYLDTKKNRGTETLKRKEPFRLFELVVGERGDSDSD